MVRVQFSKGIRSLLTHGSEGHRTDIARSLVGDGMLPCSGQSGTRRRITQGCVGNRMSHLAFCRNVVVLFVNPLSCDARQSGGPATDIEIIFFVSLLTASLSLYTLLSDVHLLPGRFWSRPLEPTRVPRPSAEILISTLHRVLRPYTLSFLRISISPVETSCFRPQSRLRYTGGAHDDQRRWGVLSADVSLLSIAMLAVTALHSNFA